MCYWYHCCFCMASKFSRAVILFSSCCYLLLLLLQHRWYLLLLLLLALSIFVSFSSLTPAHCRCLLKNAVTRHEDLRPKKAAAKYSPDSHIGGPPTVYQVLQSYCPTIAYVYITSYILTLYFVWRGCKNSGRKQWTPPPICTCTPLKKSPRPTSRTSLTTTTGNQLMTEITQRVQCHSWEFLLGNPGLQIEGQVSYKQTMWHIICLAEL